MTRKAKLGSEAARALAALRRTFGGGRPRVPKGCPRCGHPCESARAAWRHCVKPRAQRQKKGATAPPARRPDSAARRRN